MVLYIFGLWIFYHLCLTVFFNLLSILILFLRHIFKVSRNLSRNNSHYPYFQWKGHRKISISRNRHTTDINFEWEYPSWHATCPWLLVHEPHAGAVRERVRRFKKYGVRCKTRKYHMHKCGRLVGLVCPNSAGYVIPQGWKQDGGRGVPWRHASSTIKIASRTDNTPLSPNGLAFGNIRCVEVPLIFLNHHSTTRGRCPLCTIWCFLSRIFTCAHERTFRFCLATTCSSETESDIVIRRRIFNPLHNYMQ